MIVPDLLRDGLDLVLCGTAPSRASKEAGAYYAHPGNIFWKTLFDVSLTPRLVAPKDYACLLAWNIGLTDLNKTEWGADSELSHAAFDVAAFSGKMRRNAPRVIAFTSKFAASQFFGKKALSYGLQPETLFDSALFVAPSTSGRARNYFQIEHWSALAALVHSFR